MRLLYPPPFKL